MGIILGKGAYYGEIRSESESAGIILSEYDYTAEKTDWHHHENPYFMYLIQGNLYDRNEKRETQCSAGDLMFHNWQEAHWNQKESREARGFHIEFDRSWYGKHKLGVDLWEGSQRIADPRVHHILARIYAEFKRKDAYTELSIELLLIELCESVEQREFQNPSKEPDWIARLKNMVHSQDMPLDLASLSKSLGVHPVHISRAMPRYLSSTLGVYIRDQRIKQSMSYLMDEHSSITLSQIAYICGFSDQSHFTRSFKARFGITPGAYRKRLKT